MIFKTCLDNLVAMWLKVHLTKYFSGHAYLPVPIASIGENYVMKNRKTATTITFTSNYRLPENVQMILYLFLRSLIPSAIGFLETDEIWQTLPFTNIHETSMAFRSVRTQNYSQFASTFEAADNAQFQLIDNASRCIHMRHAIPSNIRILLTT